MTLLEKALFSAIEIGDVLKVRECISDKVDVNVKKDELFTPLYRAIFLLEQDIDGENRYRKIINELLNAGADPFMFLSAAKPGFNALQSIIYRGCRLYDDNRVEQARIFFDVIVELLERFNTTPGFYESLNQSLVTGHGKLVGVPHTLLHMAVYFGWPRMVNKLLEYHPDINSVNGCGLTALHLSVLVAIYDDKPERKIITAKLLSYYTVLNPRLLNRAWVGTWHSEWDKLSVPKAISIKGISSYKILGNDDTILHTAAIYNQESLIKQILKYDIDVSAKNLDKKTAEQIARDNKNIKLIKCFDEAKLEKNKIPENNHSSALQPRIYQLNSFCPSSTLVQDQKKLDQEYYKERVQLHEILKRELSKRRAFINGDQKHRNEHDFDSNSHNNISESICKL